MKAHTLVLCACVAGCVIACSSARHAVEASAWPAGGAVAGAAAGSLVGPGGTLVGAGVGAVVGHAVGENAELRSGTLQGSGAADKEADRWRGEAIRKTGLADELTRLLRLLALGSAGYFAWLRREWLARAFKGPDRVKSFLHAIWGGQRSRPSN